MRDNLVEEERRKGAVDPEFQAYLNEVERVLRSQADMFIQQTLQTIRALEPPR